MLKGFLPKTETDELIFSQKFAQTGKYSLTHTDTTKTDTKTSKLPPRHTGIENERDKNTYKHKDSDIQTDKERHRDKQTPA